MDGALSQGAVLGRRDGWHVAAGPLVGVKGPALWSSSVPRNATGGDFAERALSH